MSKQRTILRKKKRDPLGDALIQTLESAMGGAEAKSINERTYQEHTIKQDGEIVKVWGRELTDAEWDRLKEPYGDPFAGLDGFTAPKTRHAVG